MAKKQNKSRLEEIIEQLLAKGRKVGSLTSKEITDALHEEVELTAEQLDDMYEILQKSNIDVITDDVDSDVPQEDLIDDEDESDAALAAAEMEDSTDGRIVFDHNSPMLDLAAICWEELMLALPVTPLCRQDCKGLCAGCGVNLNEGMCACTEEEGDPRMAALRGLTLHKN